MPRTFVQTDVRGTMGAMTRLAGKVALVTGASSGIGAAIALEFGRQAAQVVVNYVGSAAGAQAVVQQIPEAVAIQADVSQAAEVASMVDQAISRFGRVDVLVNNAGIERHSPFLEKSEADWDAVLAVNLKGPFLCTQAVARDIVRRKARGTIINISSVHEELPFPGYADYCAAKGGLRMLCRDLALELAPYGINIVNVAPGAIATPINKETLGDPAKIAALEHEIPLHRIGTPDEVAQLVAYLASDAAAYMTGTTVFIDGGLMQNTGGL
ncbi:MAG: glucose 1-dehydrogenase [Chloroflexi bacterium]|nr:glucose 1-dehydrogenase [Chloroflexota bacterium]